MTEENCVAAAWPILPTWTAALPPLKFSVSPLTAVILAVVINPFVVATERLDPAESAIVPVAKSIGLPEVVNATGAPAVILKLVAAVYVWVLALYMVPVNVTAPVEVRVLEPLTPALPQPILAIVMALPVAVKDVNAADAPNAPPIVTDPAPPMSVNI